MQLVKSEHRFDLPHEQRAAALRIPLGLSYFWYISVCVCVTE